MLRFFSVKNFRQFRKELVFDFTNTRDYQFNSNCVKNGLVNKAIIYGKNAVGKTSLMEAMRDIYYMTIGTYVPEFDAPYRNADADDDENMQFHYTFQLDGTIIDYSYEKTDYTHVIAEKFSLDNTVIFEYDRRKKYFNFDNVGAIGAEQLNWDTFQLMDVDEDRTGLVGTLTALRFVFSNTAMNDGSLLRKFMWYLSRMRFSSSMNTLITNRNLKHLLGSLANSGEDAVNRFQSFLNEFGVDCKLTVLKEVDGKSVIYFDNKTPLAFFENMSSGTMLLTKFYLQFMTNSTPFTFLFIDEFDAYYHYELSEKIVRLLEEDFECQVVLTTHNTNLLSNSIMRPDCFLILHDGKLTPICDATTRELRQGHNLEKLYMSGEFDAE
ncbi:MAG: AAA family ATPase [Oscillospiraceae bacterium]|nr:AAA family ATPase [Oscillospiraceae bacterium]